MSSMGAKLVTGGILAILGLALLKLILAVMGIFVFFLVKIVPILLIGMLVVWIFRRLMRSGNSATSTTA